MTNPMNEPRKDPFHLFSLNSHSPQFQELAGATPLYSLSACHHNHILHAHLIFLQCASTCDGFTCADEIMVTIVGTANGHDLL
jgi:hypothetical protein